ncbi:MAG: alpha-ketoglutarate-dependent dioxygenase AlkB [Candidatus Eisenbacteria bacterium]
MPRWIRTETPPDGLRYVPDFLSIEEEAALLPLVESLPFAEVRMKGVAAKRTTAHFGWSYAYESWSITPAEPIPEFLRPLRDRAARESGVDGAEFGEVLVTRYPAGAGIGWHRDAPGFGEPVAGVSLLAPCVMRLRQRRAKEGGGVVYALPIAPRSLYALSGPARWSWQHTIPAVKSLRYSITFRVVRAARGVRGALDTAP